MGLKRGGPEDGEDFSADVSNQIQHRAQNLLQLEALEGQKETQNKWEMTQPQAQTQTQTQKGASS